MDSNNKIKEAINRIKSEFRISTDSNPFQPLVLTHNELDMMLTEAISAGITITLNGKQKEYLK